MKNRWIDVIIREGTFFLGSGGGGGLGNFGIFFLKEVLALPCVLIKKNTPDPPPLGYWKKCNPPLTTTR